MDMEWMKMIFSSKHLDEKLELVLREAEENRALLQALREQNECLRQELADLKMAAAEEELRSLLQGLREEQGRLEATVAEIQKDAKSARSGSWSACKVAKEVLWAEIFKSTITESPWLKDRSFSPGRWAVGYQYLYAVYRILSQARPMHILELGLGQSTRLIAQYAASAPECKHTIVEHDPAWIRFFTEEFSLPGNSHILQLELDRRQWGTDDQVRCYRDFASHLAGQTFDFISIDAPFGYDAKVYARVDVLDLLPQCLADQFVIVVDDYNRPGEQHMVADLERILTENGIPYARGRYEGEKTCLVIASEKYRFLTSL